MSFAIDDVYKIIEGYETILIIVGLIMVLFGFVFHQFLVALPGILLGGIIGFILVLFGGQTEPILGLFIGAIVGGALAIFLEEAIVFVLGCLIFITVTLLAKGDASLVAIVILGIIGGLTALWLRKFWIITSTSFFGAFLISIGIESLNLVLILLLTIIGIAFQYGVAQKLSINLQKNKQVKIEVKLISILKKEQTIISKPQSILILHQQILRTINPDIKIPHYS